MEFATRVAAAAAAAAMGQRVLLPPPLFSRRRSLSIYHKQWRARSHSNWLTRWLLMIVVVDSVQLCSVQQVRV